MDIITIQPSAQTDHITEDGTELQKLPYPFHVNERGEIQRQDFWQGRVLRVIGFQRDLARHEIDIWWNEVWAEPDRALNNYVVTLDSDGGMAVHTGAISRAERGVIA